MATVIRTAAALGSCAALSVGLSLAAAPAGQAKNGDTHIVGLGIVKTIDCNESTLFVNGQGNYITALGSCWGITIQGANNTVIADNVVNDVTVYGFDQTVLFKTGDPALVDRGRELGMTNIISRIPG